MSSYRERFYKLRNFQSEDFWAMVFARPLTILFLFPIIEIKWITPNKLTVLASVVKLISLYYICFDFTFNGALIASILINAGLILDNMDGTIARYRGTGTQFGFYFDKSTDAITLTFIFWAMGYRAYVLSGNVIDIALPFAAISGAIAASYVKWVAEVTQKKMDLAQIYPDKNKLLDYAKKQIAQHKGPVPPKRSVFDWIKWLLKAIISIFKFNEVDFFFWAALALLTGYMEIFSRYLSFFVTLGLVVGPGLFAVRVYKREKELKGKI